MLEQLSRYFTAAHHFRRSERSLVRGGAVMELETLRGEVRHPKLLNRINTTLNEHYASKARASAKA